MSFSGPHPASRASGSFSLAAEPSRSNDTDQDASLGDTTGSQYAARPSAAGHKGSDRIIDGVVSGDGSNAGGVPQSADRIGHQSSVRRAKSRKKGGFLLSGMFSSSPTKSPSARDSRDVKGKRKADDPHSKFLPNDDLDSLEELPDGNSKSAFSSVAINHAEGFEARRSKDVSANGVEDGYDHRDMHNGYQHNDGQRMSGSDDSHDASVSNIDPSQIVNMALNLSESRRRNYGSGQLLSPPAQSGRRATAAAMTGSIPTLSGGYHGSTAGGSLQQYLQQQRRVSRNMSPSTGKRSASTKLASSVLTDPSRLVGSEPVLHVSAATLTRAEKFRRYMDLHMEYRRLLQYLPALKPQSNNDGDDYHTSGVHSTSMVEIRRAPTKPTGPSELGRKHNPIQLIRNRKLRARSRNPLRPDAENWDDTDTVAEWVDMVGYASEDPNYRVKDTVHLPAYPLEGTYIRPSTAQATSDSLTKKKARIDWHFNPQELLADAYWLEQGHNKALLEDPHGNLIFGNGSFPDLLQPRASHESRRSGTGSFSLSADGKSVKDNSDGENHDEHRRGRLRLLGHHHGDTTGRLRHVWHKARRRSTSRTSDLSVSDDEEGNPRLSMEEMSSRENIGVGPLQRHMDNIMAIDTQHNPASPQLVTPGTPGKWGREGINAITKQQEPKAEQDKHPLKSSPLQQRTDVTDFEPDAVVSNMGVPRLKLAHPSNGSKTSVDGYASTATDSPTNTNFVPSIGVDLSPPSSRQGSPIRKVRKGLIPFMRAEGHRIHDHLGHSSDVEDHRIPRSVEEDKRQRSSLDLSSPIRSKKPLSHARTNDSYSSQSDRPSSRGNDSKLGKEPHSSPRRFWKSGRIGEIVRSEGPKGGDNVRKRDSPLEGHDYPSSTSTDQLDDYDTDGSINSPPAINHSPYPLKRSATSSSTVTEQRYRDKKGLFYNDHLPAFTHTAGYRSDGSRPRTPPPEDHIASQQDLVRSNRSPRFDRLAPPNLDLSRLSSRNKETHSNPLSRVNTVRSAYLDDSDSRRGSEDAPSIDLRKTRSRPQANQRLQKILNTPGVVGLGDAAVPWMTGLANVNSERSRSPRLRAGHGRHWSISDLKSRSRSPMPPVAKTVMITKADVARVHALLLCSGVKAAGLVRRAFDPNPDGPSSFLADAAKTADRKLDRLVPRREEHVFAARMLATALDTDTKSVRNLASSFQKTATSDLHAQLGHLRQVVEDCNEHTRELGDGTAAFLAEVTGPRGIEVRRTMDRLEKLSRLRNRRLRYLRRFGFALVEWMILLVLWAVWFVVVIFKTIFGSIKGVFTIVRWVLFLD